MLRLISYTPGGPLGVPQGGILSPLLSNIYLHELDVFVEQLMNLKLGPIYISQKIKIGGPEGSPDKEIRQVRLERNALRASRIRTGTRIRYVRYADDWIVGIIGNKETTLLIKNQIANFLREKLKITLSEEKTRISHFPSGDKVKFLGVYLKRGEGDPKPKESKSKSKSKVVDGAHGKLHARVNHVRMNYLLPRAQLLEKLAADGFLKNYTPGQRIITNAIAKWIFLDHRSIILRYNAVINGLLNYYSFVDNYHELHLLINFILKHSCAKTLARKFRLKSRAGAFHKFGPRLATNDPVPVGLNIPTSFSNLRL